MQGVKQTLSEIEVGRVRELRKAGRAYGNICKETGFCYGAVVRACFDVDPMATMRGRSPVLTEEDKAEIIRLRKAHVPLNAVARRFRIGKQRVCGIFDAAVAPGVREQKERFEPTAVQRVATLQEDMIRSGVPITPIHIEACRGHSRQWMRLYMLRVRNPDYRDNLEAADAVPRRHLCALHY
jgi:hypothetical protein